MGDFTGFSFNGVHIDNVHIVRVSDGSRYNDTILPTFTDKTVVVPGGNGTYFFGSYYTQKPFTLQVAFDELTEENLRTLRQTFNGQVVGNLVFDEQPYKKYIVKVQSAPQLKYLCFDVDEVSNLVLPSNANNREMWTLTGTGRVYKGEGTIQLVAYEPFARSVAKYLSDYTTANYPNKDEWKDSTGMLADQGQYDTCSITNSSKTARFKLYNPGDAPTHFKCTIPAAAFTKLKSITCGGVQNVMTFTAPVMKGSDVGARINSKTNLIEGVDANGKATGNLYNEYITTGDFFLIPQYTDTTVALNFDINTNAAITSNGITLDYDYLYY